MRVLWCLMVVTSCVVAQRETADLEWQKRHARIEYNVVSAGRHKLDELQVGQNWRMGRNEASLLKTECAILSGEDILVPGSYRVVVNRSAEKDFALAIEGGSLGAAPQGSPAAVLVKGTLGKPDKPAKSLEITLKADGKAAASLQPAKVTVAYGENQLVVALSLVGTKSMKSQGWTLDAFSLPEDTVSKRMTESKPTPVAALKKESGDRKNPFHVWNLVVTKDGAELWPAPVGPTDAFSEVKGLPSGAMVKATSVKWEDAKDPKPFLEASKFEVAKGKGATIVLAVGKQACTVAIPEPTKTE